MKKIVAVLSLFSVILTSVFAQASDQHYVVSGRLEKKPSGYLLTAHLKGRPFLMINITKESGQKFGECAEGEFVVDFVSRSEKEGLDIVDMRCSRGTDWNLKD